VYVGETFDRLAECRFWAVNCTKMRLAAGLCPDLLGGAIALSRPPNLYKGRDEGKRMERVGKLRKKWRGGKGRTSMGRERWEGHGGMERGGRIKERGYKERGLMA